MQTKNLIQSTVNVVKITNLKLGDVVKIVEVSQYDDGIQYGVVTELLNDGEKTFIQFLSYKKAYNEITAKFRTYKGDTDLNIFPCDPEEIQEYFKDAITDIKRRIEDKKRELNDLVRSCDKAVEFSNMELSKKLTKCSYREISQSEYNNQKQQLLGG